ncbi:hypothetical protein ABZ743_07995 [Streptomyces sp. NPDC006662]|uniref:hypothetical protein n=1 Tax=Streptomyces sp. NPDC006662 TaxID=3156902 RepID=UPI0033CB668C
MPQLQIPGDATGEGVPIRLEQVRRTLYDRSADHSVRTALWYQVADRASLDADRSPWPTAVVWLGLPGLRRTAFKLSHNLRAERAEVEAELVTCYLEALTEIDGDTPDPGSRILRSACTRAWSTWRTTRLEIAVEDVGGTEAVPTGIAPNGLWQVDYDPSPTSSGLSASLRITVPADRAEGVRIGALAQAWGLADTAAGERVRSRGRQVGAVSLRRAGGGR